MKKLIGAVLAVVMAVSLLTVTAGADVSILDTPKTKISSGKTYTLTYKEAYENDYKLTLSEDGDLKINLECNEERLYIKLYDSKGEIVKKTKASASIGSWEIEVSSDYLKRNSYSKKANGVIEWKNLKKGTYYIRFSKAVWMNRGFKYTVTATFPEDGTVPVNAVTIQQELKKGETLQLSASLSPSNATGSVTWKSDKPSVATVSKTGEVKAVGKGTAVITCTVGKKSDKIIIKVT